MNSECTLNDRLILFRIEQDSLLSHMDDVYQSRRAPAEVLSELLIEAVHCGWEGNLWHCCLAMSLAMNENVYSLACERREAIRDSLRHYALEDMRVYRELWQRQRHRTLFEEAFSFTHKDVTAQPGKGTVVMDLVKALDDAEPTEEAWLEVLEKHYRDNGVGIFGLESVFRIREEDGTAVLFPVQDRPQVKLSDLVGYKRQKKQLVANTTAFLAGQAANNVLLYGDAGTGKSTSIQAIANTYASEGLRLIEVYKHQFGLIPDIIRQIKKRNYRFILFMDDLSFEENETSYKQLKAVMEGGGEAAPENMLIYATSNRRHLVRETFRDRNDMEHDEDIHRSDTMEEKLSLAGRFGLQILYPNPTFEEYQNIVRTLAGRYEMLEDLDPETLRSIAGTWQVRHANRSGRSAQQLINSLLTDKATGKDT